MLQAAPLIRPCLLSPPTRPLTHSHPPHSQATNTNTNTNTSASAIEEIQSRPPTQPFYSIIQRQTQVQYFWLIHTLWAYFFFKIPCLVQPQNLRQKDPNRRLIVSRFDQILSLVNCLRTLRRLKGRATAVHNESIPHHCNFDKGAEFLAKFWVVRTGIEILPTGFLCYPLGKKPSSGWCPAAPNGGGETRSQYWFVREESEKYWEIMKKCEKHGKYCRNISGIVGKNV